MYCLSTIGCVPLALKILNNFKSRSKGFMGWSKQPNNHFGMLFVHKHECPQSYWMHTVPFDIDCLGFDKHNRLIEILPLEALSMASRSFSKPVRYVVEVRGGWCKEHGIKGGEKLFIKKL